jgi:hypothetical protein
MNIQYAAGFLDGEGCIGFSINKNSVFPRVLIVNTNRNVLEMFQKRWGGDIKSSRVKGKPIWKERFTWRLSWSKCVSFLSQVEPFLVIKNKQAHTVFAWDAIRPGKGRSYEKESVDFLISRMRWINKKGVFHSKDPVEIALSKAGKSKKKK